MNQSSDWSAIRRCKSCGAGNPKNARQCSQCQGTDLTKADAPSGKSFGLKFERFVGILPERRSFQLLCSLTKIFETRQVDDFLVPLLQERNASSSQRAMLRPYRIGRLLAPTGKLVAFDLMSTNSPFSQTVPPGSYPVFGFDVRAAWDPDAFWAVAFVLIKFLSDQPTRFEPALKDADSDSYYFGVDTAWAGFADEQVVEDLNHAKEYDVMNDPQFEKLRRYGSIPVSGSAKGNLIVSASGYGDGRYPCYWGYSQKDEVCCLVADFHVLNEGGQQNNSGSPD